MKSGHQDQDKSPQGWVTELHILVSSPTWPLLLTKPNRPENGFPQSDVKPVALTSAPARSLVAPRMACGSHAWGMSSAQRFMDPKHQQNKTKSFLTGTKGRLQRHWSRVGQLATFLLLILMTEGGKTTVPGLLSCGLWPELHQQLVPFSESYRCLKSIRESQEGTKATARSLSSTGARGS